MTASPFLLADTVNVRLATADDEAALLALHQAGFGSQWDSRHWRWRFVDNPTGRTTLVGAFTPAGDCVAAFCGVPLPCLLDGERSLAVRAGDVCVHPRLRHSMAGSTVLLRTSDLFFRTFGGAGTRIIYGFPEPGLARTIVRHCRVDVMSDVLWLVGDAGDDARPPATNVHVGAIPDDVDELARRWHRDRSAFTGVVRDAAYLRWRYGTNPHTRYVAVAARDPHGELSGLCILRAGGPQPDSWCLVEWLVPREQTTAARELFAAARTLARRHGQRHLVASFATSSPEFAEFQQVHGFRVLGSAYQCVYRSYAPPMDRRFLVNHWFHSLGDLDFV